MQLDRHASRAQCLGVGDVLVDEQIERPNADVGRRKPLQVRRAGDEPREAMRRFLQR